MFDILEKDLKNEKSYMIVDLIVEMFVNSSSKKQACSLAETLVSVSQCLENMFLKYCKICFDKCFWLMNNYLTSVKVIYTNPNPDQKPNSDLIKLVK